MRGKHSKTKVFINKFIREVQGEEGGELRYMLKKECVASHTPMLQYGSPHLKRGGVGCACADSINHADSTGKGGMDWCNNRKENEDKRDSKGNCSLRKGYKE